jgi:hypothetical protein
MSEQQVQLTAEDVAQNFKPNWKVVSMPNTPDDALSFSKADASVPEMKALRHKYFGDSQQAYNLRSDEEPAGESSLVNMQPESTQDNRVGRKALFVQNGEVVGEQG